MAVEQLFVVSIHDFFFFLFLFFDLVCSVTFSWGKKKKKKFRVAHPQAGFINHFLIHNLHIYLRVDIRKADMGQFVDFVVTSVAAQKCLPASSPPPRLFLGA